MSVQPDYMFSDSIEEFPTAPALVLGLGNCLIEDEGIGIAAIEYLHKHFVIPKDVELFDGGTSGMGLLDDLRSRQHVIVLDAVNTGHQPGELVVLTGDEVPVFFGSKASPHQLALSDVLAVLTLTDEQPGNISVIGVEPVSLKTRIGLSDLVTQQLVPMVNKVIEQLEQIGYQLEPKPQTNDDTYNPLDINYYERAE